MNFPREIDGVPSSEGVYLLGDSYRNVIYVGRADDLNQRLAQHPDPQNPCLQRKKVSYFAYEVTRSSENREQELIDRYNPECNRT